MGVIADFVNSSLHHRNGVAPPPNPTLRAFTGAWLLQHGLLGVDTVTKAVVVAGSSRPSVEAALVILKSEDEQLLGLVLVGDISLQNAAARVKRRADLIASFRSAWPEDRVAFAQAVGPDAVFDSLVAALVGGSSVTGVGLRAGATLSR